MSSKHNILSKKEFESSKINPSILNQIDYFFEKNPLYNKEDLRVLDWGCGRGISVLKLLEKGYSAIGVDIDRDVMENGYKLFEEYGYKPREKLKPVKDLAGYPDNHFQVIFSEQVFEHAENIEQVISEQSRLTSPGGVGYHVFPASKMIMEGHLRMPLVHWLPKNRLRILWIISMMLINMKPQKNWPEVEDKTFLEEAQVYYNYSNTKTYYRDNRELKQLFLDHDLEATYVINNSDSLIRKFLPNSFILNGFPDQQVAFFVEKNG